MSVAPTYDSQKRSIESGIDPSPGCSVTASDSELAAGKDAILDFAQQLLLKENLSAPAGVKY